MFKKEFNIVQNIMLNDEQKFSEINSNFQNLGNLSDTIDTFLTNIMEEIDDSRT